MSLYLNKSTEEILTLKSEEILSFLIDEAKCSKEDVENLIKRPTKEILEFLISRLRGRAVNLDYEMLLEVLSADKAFLDSVTTTIIKTVGVNVEAELERENVLGVEVVQGSLEMALSSSSLNVTLESGQIGVDMKRTNLDLEVIYGENQAHH